MTLGLRSILLLVAGILFIVAALGDENDFDLLAIGLALLAFALLVPDLRLGGRLRRFNR